jgi:hypothetical protein
MANEYYNRYDNFIFNGVQITVPYVQIPAKLTDKTYVYRLGISRLDKVSQQYYGTPYFGWFILNINGFVGGSEVNIPDNTVLKIPFPLQSSLLDYKSALDTYFFYYGKL